MTIDWAAFSPSSALAGGAIIGLAAALFALINGRARGSKARTCAIARPHTGTLGGSE